MLHDKILCGIQNVITCRMLYLRKMIFFLVLKCPSSAAKKRNTWCPTTRLFILSNTKNLQIPKFLGANEVLQYVIKKALKT